MHSTLDIGLGWRERKTRKVESRKYNSETEKRKMLGMEGINWRKRLVLSWVVVLRVGFTILRLCVCLGDEWEAGAEGKQWEDSLA